MYVCVLGDVPQPYQTIVDVQFDVVQNQLSAYDTQQLSTLSSVTAIPVSRQLFHLVLKLAFGSVGSFYLSP